MSTITNLNDLVVDSITINGVAVSTAVLLASGQAVDLNGEAGGLILDAAAVEVIDGHTAGHVKLTISAATVLDIISTGVTVTGTEAVSGIITATGGIVSPVTTISGDGAITISPTAQIYLTKGSAAAITIAAPTATTHDGYVVRVFSGSAFAHVITSSVDGFNAKGSSGTITFAANKGSSTTLIAMSGHWYTLAGIGATVA